MTAISDSAAHFETRAREYGIPDDFTNRLGNAGVRTMASLAFAINRPGQEFNEGRFDAWIAAVNLGVQPTLGVVASVRRLHFEAEIVLTASLRASVESSAHESAGPKAIPHALG